MSELTQEVTSQRRTIIGQVEYSLQFMNSLKKQLMDVSNPHAQVNWAVGGFIAVLVSGLLHQIDENILKNTDEVKTAVENLNDIKKHFSDFIDLMLVNAEPETPFQVL